MEFIKEHVNKDWLPVVEKFPKIFLEPSEYVIDIWEKYYKDFVKKEDMVNLRYGFEHGIGWKDIVIGFCEDLQKLAEKAAAEGHTFQYKGCIIKEKFGKFTPQGDLEKSEGAWEIYRDEYYGICRKWEEKSLTVCEVCGKDGELRSTKWWKTRCDEHYQKQRDGQ
jgi:hypothetical protein